MTRRSGWMSSPRAHQEAEEFLLALEGMDARSEVSHRRDFFDDFGVRSGRARSGRSPSAERGPHQGPSRSGSIPPRSLSYYEQWVANVVGDDGTRLAAPLGKAWCVQRLLGPSKPARLGAAARTIRDLDAQRTSRTATNYQVDTAQTRVFRDTSAALLPALQSLDTSLATAARCGQTFSSTNDLATRKAHWRSQIDRLARADRPALLRWIIGKQTFSSNTIIKAATDEAKAQIDCLRRAINTARTGTSIAPPGTRGPTRNFDTQLCIWLWKYFFKSTRSGMGTICSSSGATYAFGSMTRGAVATCHAAAPSSRRRFSVGAEWDPASSTHRTAWTTHLSATQREKEILQTSSAPGISRHHWGTDVDFGSVSGSAWRSGGHLALYRWLQEHSMSFGISQVYTPDRPGYGPTSPQTGYDGYIEERWHWSYYPVAQALLEWAHESSNKARLQARLTAAWSAVGTSSTYSAARSAVGWTGSVNPFSHVASQWEAFFFNVNRHVTPPVI